MGSGVEIDPDAAPARLPNYLAHKRRTTIAPKHRMPVLNAIRSAIGDECMGETVVAINSRVTRTRQRRHADAPFWAPG